MCNPHSRPLDWSTSTKLDIAVQGFHFIIYNLQKPWFLCILGQRYVLMNQHLLLHLAKSVYDRGPLFSSSLFVFEDWNGDIGNYFHGTQNIANQVRL